MKKRLVLAWFSSRGIIIILLAGLLTGCMGAGEAMPPPDYWPTSGWQTDPPDQHGIDPELLADATAKVGTEPPFLDSLLVIRNGYIVYEEYFNGYSTDSLHDLASVTKSWTSAVLGVAQAQGTLSDLEEPLLELLPSYFNEGGYADKREITLADLLMMRSGIEFNDSAFSVGEYGGLELLEQDLTEFALGFPMAYEPGETWNYSTLDSQLLSAVTQVAMGESVGAIAERKLFDPMGIEEYEWLEDGTGTTIGGSELSQRPRDMAKLGMLYLHQGQWEGKQLVPKEWIQESTSPQNSEAYYEPSDQVETIEWYGYHWWTWKPEWFHGYRALEAKGYGGQEVVIIPELDLIMVTTANNEGISPGVAEQQEEAIYDLLHDRIMPALEEIELSE